MSLPTNRRRNDLIEAADINAIAAAVNSLVDNNTGGVTSVNGYTPDSSGNVTIPISGGGGGSGLTEDPANPGLYLIDTEPTTITVTATAPTFTDLDGTENDRYTIPTKTGVEYLVDGVVKTAGTYIATGTVTVVARATTGYKLSGTSSWSHTFSTGTAPVSVTANPPVADDDANTITWTGKTGVEYLREGAVVTSPVNVGDVDTSVTITARATNGYVLSGTSSWTFTFTKAVTVPTTVSAAYSDAVMADAPVVFYRLNEATGVTPVDSMGNSTATVTGVTLGDPAKLLDPDTSALISSPESAATGANAITIGQPAALNSPTGFTFEAIIRNTDRAGGFLNRSDAATKQPIVIRNNGNGALIVIVARWDTYTSPNDTLPWHTTYHLAITLDGANLRVYLNGAEVWTTTATVLPNNADQPWEIGRQDTYEGGRNSFPGRMAGVALYNKALTAAQVLAHAQAAGRAA